VSSEELGASDGLSIAGVVLNSPRVVAGDASVDSNADEIARRCIPPLLAIVEHGGGFDRVVDWANVAQAEA
jgi:hypothetical protein